MLIRVLAPALVVLCVAACAAADGDGAAESPTTLPATTTEPPAASTTTVLASRALGTLVVEADERPGEEDGAEDGAPSAAMRALADLQLGDCIDLDGLEEAVAEVTEVAIVDCVEPHDAEVYALVSLDDDPTSRHPGDEHVLAAADRVCLDAFEGYVGARYVDTRLEIVHLRPTVASWARGDRRVICAVVNAGAAPLVGSVAGAGAGAP
jgi:hypothetical protein